MQVAIVNYGMGNLRSVANAIDAVGGAYRIADSVTDLDDATHIILPGVGAFGEAMARLKAAGFVEALAERVLRDKVPFLGICLGMQLLATRSFEHGEHDGLGWIAGEVRPIAASEGLRVPHMGWNVAHVVRDSPLFRSLPPTQTFYFVHSFHHVPADPARVLADTEYGDRLAAVIGQDHIFGTQFHPEKSQKSGLLLLRNFLDLGNYPC
jgi:imidazole glycerol-phosphate synthase subunit HisH